MTSLRTKGKSTIVWILLGMLLLGLGGFGVRNFSGGAVGSIGSVGDTDIGTDDYLRGTIDQNMPLGETAALRLNLMGASGEIAADDLVYLDRIADRWIGIAEGLRRAAARVLTT